MRRMLSCLGLLAVLSGCASTGEPQRLVREATVELLPFLERHDARHDALVRTGAQSRSAALVGEGRVLDLRRLAVLPDGNTLWLAPDGSGFTFDEGLLVATRGVGNDLMSSDLSQLRALLRAGRDGTAERFHSLLDGEGRIVLRSYVCSVTISGQIAREDCAGLSENFINTYQISPGTGRVLSSRQQAGRGIWQFGPIEAPSAAMPTVKETP